MTMWEVYEVMPKGKWVTSKQIAELLKKAGIEKRPSAVTNNLKRLRRIYNPRRVDMRTCQEHKKPVGMRRMYYYMKL